MINTNGTIIPVYIGKRGENAVTQVQFDFLDWFRELGEGALVLLIQRPGDRLIYPVELAMDGTTATWTVTETDTAIKGIGKATLQYMVGEQIKKSKIFRFVIDDSLTSNGKAPDPYADYVRQILVAEQAAAKSASAAAQSAEEASQYRPRIIDGLIYL